MRYSILTRFLILAILSMLAILSILLKLELLLHRKYSNEELLEDKSLSMELISGSFNVNRSVYSEVELEILLNEALEV